MLPWTPEEDDQLRLLRDAGASLERIAEKLNRTANAVDRRIDKLNLPRRQHTTKAPDEYERIREYLRRPRSRRDIAAHVGIPDLTVSRRLKALSEAGVIEVDDSDYAKPLYRWKRST